MANNKTEAVERAKFQYLIKKYPKLKTMLDNFGVDKNPDAQEIVKNVIEDQLHSAFMRGTIAGWYAFGLRAIKNIDKMSSVEEIKEYFQQEFEKSKERLNLTDDMIYQDEELESSLDE